MPGAAFAQVNCYVMSLGRPSLKAHVSKARPSVRSIGHPSWLTGLALRRRVHFSLHDKGKLHPFLMAQKLWQSVSGLHYSPAVPYRAN